MRNQKVDYQINRLEIILGKAASAEEAATLSCLGIIITPPHFPIQILFAGVIIRYFVLNHHMRLQKQTTQPHQTSCFSI